MQVECLRDAVFWLDVMPAVCLRPVDEFQVLGLADPRHRAQAVEFCLQIVSALNRADENTVLLAVVMAFRFIRFELLSSLLCGFAHVVFPARNRLCRISGSITNILLALGARANFSNEDK